MLANAGATLVAASLEDTAAIVKALEGATSLFPMTVLSEGADAETRQGMVAADAAKAAGVHLVLISVGSANRQTGLPHFDSKYEIEKQIAPNCLSVRDEGPGRVLHRAVNLKGNLNLVWRAVGELFEFVLEERVKVKITKYPLGDCATRASSTLCSSSARPRVSSFWFPSDTVRSGSVQYRTIVKERSEHITREKKIWLKEFTNYAP